jgi:hypothetical protein
MIEFKDHPIYEEKAKKWQVYLDLFDGDHGTIAEKYLIKHNIERSQRAGALPLLQARKERSFYTNHTSRIFKRYTGLLFKNPLQLDDKAEKLLSDYGAIEDIDGEGNSLEEFVKRSIFKHRFLYGQVYLLTDATRASDEVRTVEQRRAENIRPFWKVLSPLEVKDWSYYRSGPEIGKLSGLRHEFKEIQERYSVLEPAKEVEGYTVYEMSQSGYVVMRFIKQGEGKDAKIMSEEEIIIPGISELPIAVVKEVDSYVKDVSPHSLKSYNLDSNIANILHHQGYQERSIIGEIDDKKIKVAGEYVNQIFPPGTEIITSSPTYPQGLIEERNRAEQEVWKTAFHLTRMMPTDSKDGEAADTLEKQREDLKAFIVTELQSLENLLNKGLKHFAMFAGQAGFDGKITLDKNVDLTNFEEELQAEIAYSEEIKQIPTWRKSVLKKRAREMQVEDLEQIEQEIEALPAITVQATAQQAAQEVLANA